MSIWDASLEAANRWYDISWYGLLICALITAFTGAVTVVFLFLQFWSSSVRDRYSDLRIAGLETRAAEANEAAATAYASASGSMAVAADAQGRAARASREAAQANERAALLEKDAETARKATAEANARALEAQLALERFKAPRTLSVDQQSRISQALRPLKIKFDVAVNAGNPEAEALMSVLEKVLIAAGWEQVNWKGGDVVLARPHGKSVGIISMVGVIIQMDPSETGTLWPAASALAALLKDAEIEAKAEGGSGTQAENKEAMHVLIGKKP